MKLMKSLILAGIVLAAGMVGEKAHATIVVSTQAYVANTVLVSTPTATGQNIYLKGCTLANSLIPVLDICVNLVDQNGAGPTKATICAPKNTTQAFPAAVSAAGNATQGTAGALPQFFGEDLKLNGAFSVTSSTPITSGMTLTCAYTVK